MYTQAILVPIKDKVSVMVLQKTFMLFRTKSIHSG